MSNAELNVRGDGTKELPNRGFLRLRQQGTIVTHATYRRPPLFPLVESLIESTAHCENRTSEAISGRPVQYRLSFDIVSHLIYLGSKVTGNLRCVSEIPTETKKRTCSNST